MKTKECSHSAVPVFDYGFGELGIGGYIRCGKITCKHVFMFIPEARKKPYNINAKTNN